MAAMMGVHKQSYYKYEAGRFPTAEALQALLTREPDLDANWLLTGQGSMFRDRDVAPDPGVVAELQRLNDLLDIVRAHVLTLRKELTAKTDRIAELEAALARLGKTTNQEAG